MSQYLSTDHTLLCTFDLDLFVSDLVRHRSWFCFRFLVHAILYWRSQMYSDESVYDFTQPFGDRAERLWTCVKSLDTLSNLAVAQLLSLAFLGHGKDYFVLICLAQSSRMATRLYLFGVEPCTALEKIKKIPQDTCSTSCYADGGSLTGLLNTVT
ncbi:hypothetical protein HYQ46_001308 [Verticillium longisporum]|nr:hypothetical protein HYQ46_001308 [Verticillium longisporum]